MSWFIYSLQDCKRMEQIKLQSKNPDIYDGMHLIVEMNQSVKLSKVILEITF